MTPIRSCLWFRSEAEEAANLHVSLFPNSCVVDVMRAGPAVVAVEFVLDGTPFMSINGREAAGFTARA